MHLPHPLHISHVPHIQAVVIIYTAEPAADGVIGNGNGVWVTGIHCGVEQMTVGMKGWDNRKRGFLFKNPTFSRIRNI